MEQAPPSEAPPNIPEVPQPPPPRPSPQLNTPEQQPPQKHKPKRSILPAVLAIVLIVGFGWRRPNRLRTKLQCLQRKNKRFAVAVPESSSRQRHIHFIPKHNLQLSRQCLSCQSISTSQIVSRRHSRSRGGNHFSLFPAQSMDAARLRIRNTRQQSTSHRYEQPRDGECNQRHRHVRQRRQLSRKRNWLRLLSRPCSAHYKRCAKRPATPKPHNLYHSASRRPSSSGRLTLWAFWDPHHRRSQRTWQNDN